MMELQIYPAKLHLNEIFQSLDIKFALVNDDWQQVQMEGKCRDFLGDIIWSEAIGHGSFEIYGSRYNPAIVQWCSSKARVSIKFPEERFKRYFIKHLPQLNKMEAKYNLEPSRFYETDNPLRIVVEGDVTWVSHEWKISLYSFLLKIASYYRPSSIRNPDDGYFKLWKVDGNAEYLMKNIHQDVMFHHDDIYAAHNQSGFVSILNNECHPIRNYFI